MIVTLNHMALIPGAYTVFRHGWLSVDVFFVLSGFVIALTYERRLQERDSLRAYLGARWRRLVPIQLLGVLLTWPLAVAAHWESKPGDYALLTVLLASIFLIPIRFTGLGSTFSSWGPAFPVNPPLWSLCCEWLVNLAYGLGICRWGNRALWALMAGALVYLAMVQLSPERLDDFFLGIGRATLGFTLGILVHRAFSFGAFRRLPSVNPWAIYAAWFVICSLPGERGHASLQVSAAALYSAGMIALLVRAERPMGRIWSFLGRISYPLYASHFAIVILSKWWQWPLSHPAIRMTLLLIMQIALAVCVQWLVSQKGQASPKPGADALNAS